MMTLMATIRRYLTELALITARVLARVAVILGVLCALVAMGKALDMDTHDTMPAATLPAPTQQAPVVDDGVANHHLFHPGATLDTSRVDDLRADPEGLCLVQDRVMTPAGACVAGVRVWQDETDTATWEALVEAGYMTSVQEPGSLWIPLAMVDLDEDDIAAIHLDRV